MNYQFRTRTVKDTQAFLTWKFDGEYSFYDNDIQKEKVEDIISLTGSDNAFSIFDENDSLVGNCEFYYIEEFFCVGLQMRPELTGKGTGTEFVKAIVEFACDKYKLKVLDLTVARFNQRAIKVYEKIGFKIIEEFVNTIRGKDYDFIAMRYEY